MGFHYILNPPRKGFIGRHVSHISEVTLILLLVLLFSSQCEKGWHKNIVCVKYM